MLTIGSIIYLKEGSKKLMILNRGPITILNVKVSDIVSIKNYAIEDIKKFDDEDLTNYLSQLTEAEKMKAENIELYNLSLERKIYAIINKMPNETVGDFEMLLEYVSQITREESAKTLFEYLESKKTDIQQSTIFNSIMPVLDTIKEGYKNTGNFINSLTDVLLPGGTVMKNPNYLGNSFLEVSENIGKSAGKTNFIIGAFVFGLGVQDDIENDGKTVGQAVAHNGVGLGIGGVATFGISLLLSTNPVGWAIVGGATAIIGTGIIADFLFEFAYDHNFLRLQDGLDWAGDQIDNVGDAINNFGDAINPLNWNWGW